MMVQLPQIQVRDDAPIPTGEYNVILAELASADGQYGEQIKFTCELTDAPYTGRRLTAYARLSDSLKSKLVQIVGVLLGRPLQAGELIPWDALLNRPCRLVVVKSVKPDGSTFNKVETVLPRTPVQAQGQADPFTQ